MQTSVRPVRAADVMPVHGLTPPDAQRGRRGERSLHSPHAAERLLRTLRWLKLSLCTAVSMCIAPFRGDRTQWVVLSAIVNKPRSGARHGGTGRCVDGADGAIGAE